MKHLWILRHAKASSGDRGQRDIDRELTARGRRQCQWLATDGVAKAVAAGAVLPDLVLVSSAARTRQTADLVGPALGEARVEEEDDLYVADTDRLVERLRLVDDEAASVMVVGHNPSVHELVLQLIDEVTAEGSLRDSFPTASLAVLALDIAWWALLYPHGARLTSLMVPPRH
jgi:phosphohistidine phosphatase